MKTAIAALMLLLALACALLLFVLREGSVAAVLGRISAPLPALSAEIGEARIFAAGDMLFDRNIRLMSGRFGEDYIFSCIDELIESADFAVANLEGPITAHASQSLGSVVGSPDNYVFTFPASTGALLGRHHFKAVSIGNNHILNFGVDGLAQTQERLAHAGVGYFGGIDGNEGIFEIEARGVPLAFVTYNEFGGSSPREVADLIARESAEGKKVIVYAHWGDEYVDSSPRLRPTAELFAQSGAAAVIGAHPHVMLGSEYIGDTLVYYSLGNFIFDQYWNEDVKSGLALILTVPKEGRVAAVEHPVEIFRDGRTCPIVQEMSK